MKNLIAAIDIGTTKIAVAVGEKTPDGVKIVAYSETPSLGIKRGRVENVRIATQSLSRAVENVEEQLGGVKINKAYVGITGQDIRCITPEIVQTFRSKPNEFISQEEIDQITSQMYNLPLLDEGDEVLCAIPQSYNVDNCMSVSEPIGMQGKIIQARFRLIVGKRNMKQLLESVLSLSKIQPIEFVASPIASAMAVLSEEEREIGCTLVDIGGGTTDIAVIQGNVVRYVAVVPFGGNTVTNDISIGIKIAKRQAENLKKNYGSCFSDYADPDKTILINGSVSTCEINAKTLSKIIQARMQEILDAINYHIRETGFKQDLSMGIVLTGGGSQVGNITNLVKVFSACEARTASPTPCTIDPSSIELAMNPAASTVVGLLIYGFKKIEEEGLTITDSVIAGKREKEKKQKTKKGLKETVKSIFSSNNLFSTDDMDEA